jgi:hypothetical protein
MLLTANRIVLRNLFILSQVIVLFQAKAKKQKKKKQKDNTHGTKVAVDAGGSRDSAGGSASGAGAGGSAYRVAAGGAAVAGPHEHRHAYYCIDGHMHLIMILNISSHCLNQTSLKIMCYIY